MNPQKLEYRLARAIFNVSKLCNFDLNDEISELYLKHLIPHGEGAIKAFEHISVTRKARDPFPSIADIKAIIQPETNEKNNAIIIANQIVTAISKFGYVSPKDAKEYIGELGWQVVRLMGGWASLCEQSNETELGVLRAQLRELAAAVYERRKLGLTNDQITLPKPKEEGNMISLGELFKQIEDRRTGS